MAKRALAATKPVKKTALKQTAAQKTAAKKTAAKKTAAQKTAAKKTATKTAAGKKAGAKKSAAKPAGRKKKPKPVLVVFDPREQAREREQQAAGPRWFPWGCLGRVAGRSAALRERIAPPLQEVWSAQLPGVPTGCPVAADDGVVYLGDRDGRLGAFELESGQPRFSLHTDGVRESSPAWPLVAEGLVPRDRVPVSGPAALHAWHLFFGDDEGIFYGVRRGEAQVLWRKVAPLSLAARQKGAYLAPLCAGELVLTVDTDGNLYGADGRSGRTVFSLFLRGRPAAPPALAPWRDLALVAARPLFPGEKPRLHAVGLSGERRWHADLPFAPGPALAATQDLVLVGGEGGLLAYAAEDGQLRWRSAGAEPCVGGLALGQERVFAPAPAGVVARELSSGATAWTSPPGTRGVTPLPGAGLLLAGDVVWCPTARGLVALEAATGKVLGRERLPGDPVGAPVCAGGMLLVATSGRVLRAWRGG